MTEFLLRLFGARVDEAVDITKASLAFRGTSGIGWIVFLILVLGILCSVFDLIYIWLLFKFAMVRIRNAVEAAN